MRNAQRWFLLILMGVGVTLGGLVWDSAIHATEHSHLVVEALLNPAQPFENPAHAVVALGLVWTAVAALSAFTLSWLEGKNWRCAWQTLSIPLALWLVMSLAGVTALFVLAQTP